jgi:CHAT domain-containing protein
MVQFPDPLGDTIRWIRWRGRMDDDSLVGVLRALSEAEELEKSGMIDGARSAFSELFRFGVEAWSEPLKAMSSAGLARTDLLDCRPRHAYEWMKLALQFGTIVAFDEPAFQEWMSSLRLMEAELLAAIHPPTAVHRIEELIGDAIPGSEWCARLYKSRAIAELARFNHESAMHDADTAIAILEPRGPSIELRHAFELRCDAIKLTDSTGAELSYIRAMEVALELARKSVDDPRYEVGEAASELVSARLMAQDTANHLPPASAVDELNALRDEAIRQQHRPTIAATDYELSCLHLTMASGAGARLHATRARMVAAASGWAWLEGAAIMLLERISVDTKMASPQSPLQAVCDVRWLDTKRAGGEPSLLDDGWLDRLDGLIAERCHAWSLAETALRRALDHVNNTPAISLVAKHAIALSRFFRDRGRLSEATELEDSLLGEIAQLRESSPRTGNIIELADEAVEQLEAARALGHKIRTPSDLNLLMIQCDKYEERVRNSRGITDGAERRMASAPPFPAAAEVALELDHLDQGFALLERGKARTLLERMEPDAQLMGSPMTLNSCRELLPSEHGIVQFLVGERALWCLFLTKTSAEAMRICRTDTPEWVEFEKAVAVGQSAAHLDHPQMDSISAAVRRFGAENEVTTIVPHDFLHNTPLHLCRDGDMSSSTFIYAPSASIAVQANSRLREMGRTVVMGDPLGDLSWAKQEAEIVAEGFGVCAHVGSDATLQSLARELDAGDSPVRLVHLACHAHFDPIRPERSGIHLAGGSESTDPWTEPWRRMDDDTLVATLSDISKLQWQGALVVVNACDSGRTVVASGDELYGITSTLLASGAAAILTSLWPVDDMAGALILTSMMHKLTVKSSWSGRDLYEALMEGQGRYRQAAASGNLLSLCEELGFEGVAAKNESSAASADPWLWAPFVLVGGRLQ